MGPWVLINADWYYTARVAVIGQWFGDHIGKAEPQCNLAQHDDAPIRRHPAAIESCVQCLALDR
jgi:hypothetical protein